MCLRTRGTLLAHKLSLVQGIIEAVEESARARKGRVLSFKVKVGELAQFDLRLGRGLLRDLKAGTSLAGAKVTVQLEKSKVKCMGCGSEFGFGDITGPLASDAKEVIHLLPELLCSYYRCPTCSKSYFEIVEGRSMKVAEVTMVA